MKFSIVEYNAILAGLRLLQQNYDAVRNADNPDSPLGAVCEILTDFGNASHWLEPDEIDALCEKINS